jgi:hypothetical protein
MSNNKVLSIVNKIANKNGSDFVNNITIKGYIENTIDNLLKTRAEIDEAIESLKELSDNIDVKFKNIK